MVEIVLFSGIVEIAVVLCRILGRMRTWAGTKHQGELKMRSEFDKLLESIQYLVDAKIDIVRQAHPHVYHEGDAKEATKGLTKGQMIVDIILDEFEHILQD